MTGDQKRNKRPFHLRKGKFGDKKSRLKVEDNEIKSLQDRYHKIQPGNIQKFTDFPLCSRTQKGLKQAEYVSPTDIQKQSIGLALQGHDILGAAKTGSGKTLAFLIPILECLFRQKWSTMDGLGALIISPTRELAYQTFEVLQKVGKTHDFSAGLVIGGKHLREEAERINRTNIVICTPGRFLQHMDETPLFNADQLQILVLDEADRILDLGFRDTLNAIIENLPPIRQTLLFSATQTKSVKDLARLSLKNPVYVSVHENAKFSTPSGLQQSYMVCELHEKMDLLWSFVKSHLKKKVLIFLQSCKQVRYMHESLRKLRPGVTVLGLHGAMNQMKRMAVYDQFCRKQSVCLLATDIAARGLDFPEVDWVVQLDCPEDANTYIHRAGRTARFQKDGEALLVLLPSEEESMIKQLHDKKIPIEQIRVNPKKQWTIQGKLEGLCAADVTHKQYAQRAFMSYLRSVFLMKNKQVFDVHKLDTAKYARSLGLAIAPRVRFLQRALARQAEAKDSKTSTSSLVKKPVDREAMPSLVDDSEDEDDSDGDDSGDDFLTVKSRIEPEPRDAAGDESEVEDAEKMNETKPGSTNKTQKVVTKAALVKKLQKKNIVANTRITFDEYGEQMEDPATKSRLQDMSDDEDTGGGINIDKAKQHMREQDKIDRQLFRQKVKEKHKEEKRKKKEQRKAAMEQSDESEDEETEVTLGNPDDAEDEVSGSDVEESDDEEQAEEDDAESEEDDDDDDDSDEEDDDNSEEDESDEEVPSVPRKRPRKDPTAQILSKDSRLEDQEAFALSLLAS